MIDDLHEWHDQRDTHQLAYRVKLMRLAAQGLIGQKGAPVVLSNVNHNVPGILRRSVKDLPAGTVMIEVKHQAACVCFSRPLRTVPGAAQFGCDCDPDIEIVQPVAP